MSSHNLHRVAPITPSAWFVAAIPATVVSLIVSMIVWSAVDSWVGGALFVVVAATGGALARRGGHDKLLAYAAGAAVTFVGLYAALFVSAHYYLSTFRG